MVVALIVKVPEALELVKVRPGAKSSGCSVPITASPRAGSRLTSSNVEAIGSAAKGASDAVGGLLKGIGDAIGGKPGGK